jgi:hypothetical protein
MTGIPNARDTRMLPDMRGKGGGGTLNYHVGVPVLIKDVTGRALCRLVQSGVPKIRPKRIRKSGEGEEGP